MKTALANKTIYTLIWYVFYNLQSGNGVDPILTAPEPTRGITSRHRHEEHTQMHLIQQTHRQRHTSIHYAPLTTSLKCKTTNCNHNQTSIMTQRSANMSVTISTVKHTER